METGSRSRTRPCSRCGALNGEGFDRCVRCAAPLGALGVGTEKLGTSVDGSKLLGTKAIMGLTILVFAGQLAAMLQHGAGMGVLFSGGTHADLLRFGALLTLGEDVQAEPFRLLSAVFVHMGVIHILMNMLNFASLGRVAEPEIGTARFVAAYVATGFLGFVGSALLELVHPQPGMTGTITAGASGAVFGIMGLVAGWRFRLKDRSWRSIAIQTVFFAVLVNLLFRDPRTGRSMIDNGAHVGGLLSGAVIGFLYAGRPRPKSLLFANITAIAGLILSILSLLLAQRAGGWGKRPTPGDAAMQLEQTPPACACVPPREAPALPDRAPLRSTSVAPCRADDSAREVAV